MHKAVMILIRDEKICHIVLSWNNVEEILPSADFPNYYLQTYTTSYILLIVFDVQTSSDVSDYATNNTVSSISSTPEKNMNNMSQRSSVICRKQENEESFSIRH